jgi:hypothetical protein
MSWTTEFPTKDGIYWYCWEDQYYNTGKHYSIIAIHDGAISYMGRDGEDSTEIFTTGKDLGGGHILRAGAKNNWWYGPFPIPLEPPVLDV